MDIVTRASKGSALTWAELDANLGLLDVRWQNLGGEIETAGIANAPVDRLYKGLIYVHAFSATVLQEFTVIFHMPKNYISGSPIYPHIHALPTTASSGDVKWGFEYCWANEYDAVDILVGPPATDQQYGSTTTCDATQDVAATHQDTNRVVEFCTPLLLPLIKGDAVIICRVFRDATDVLDTYPDEMYVTNCDLYYQAQGFGSVDR